MKILMFATSYHPVVYRKRIRKMRRQLLKQITKQKKFVTLGEIFRYAY